jgi:hypothetical protein
MTTSLGTLNGLDLYHDPANQRSSEVRTFARTLSGMRREAEREAYRVAGGPAMWCLWLWRRQLKARAELDG